MKLLIVTQKVDAEDPVLGFFPGWVSAFASEYEQVVVVAQKVGMYTLPSNVQVLSLGKEQGKNRFTQVLTFWKILLKEQSSTSAAFIHMTPIWAVLGAPIWKLCGVPEYLWYEARGTRWPLKVALLFVRKVFSASTHGMPVATRKSVVVGHGIHTQVYCPSGQRDSHSLITVGRVTASKRLSLLMTAITKLPKEYNFRVVGGPITPADTMLAGLLKKMVQQEGLTDRVTMGPLSPKDTLPLLQKATLFLHASDTSLDKALLEAMACGCLVVSCSRAGHLILPESCLADPLNMHEVALRLLTLPAHKQENIRTELRSIVEKNHSLPKLIQRLKKEMATA